MEFSDPAFLIIFVFLAFLLGLYFDKPAKGKNARSAREIQEENERLQTELEEATSAKESLEAELKELKQQTRKDGVQPESDIEQRNLIESVQALKEQVASLETFMAQLAEQNKSVSASIDSLATGVQENQSLILEQASDVSAVQLETAYEKSESANVVRSSTDEAADAFAQYQATLVNDAQATADDAFDLAPSWESEVDNEKPSTDEALPTFSSWRS